MNKYFVKIPYSYSQYATLSGYVYAEDEEEAIEIAMDREKIHEENYEDDDDSGDSNYDDSSIDIECVATDIARESIPQLYDHRSMSSEVVNLPNHFLEDLPVLLNKSILNH